MKVWLNKIRTKSFGSIIKTNTLGKSNTNLTFHTSKGLPCLPELLSSMPVAV